jgi:hypothetical protein
MSQRRTQSRRERGSTGGRGLLFMSLVVVGVLVAAWWGLQQRPDPAGAAERSASQGVSTDHGRSVLSTVPPVDGAGSDGTEVRARPQRPDAAEVLVATSPRGRFGPDIPEEGRTADLELRVTEAGLHTEARAVIVAGADGGAELPCDEEGVLSAGGLFPGCVVLEVATASGEVCRREVLLRHRKRTTLTLDFGDHGSLGGHVINAEAEPVVGALVTLDGSTQLTDGEGRFLLPRRVSGNPSVVVSAPGYARARQIVGGIVETPRDLDVQIRLQPAARLVVTVDAAPGMTGDVDLVLVPEGDPTVFSGGVLHSTFPWAELYPLRVPAGGHLVLDDLPACRIEVLAFHALGRSRPTSGMCRPGVDAELSVAWTPVAPLDLTLLRGGEPAGGCRVGLRVANPVSDRALALGAFRSAADRFPLSLLPASRQVTTSDAQGAARLGPTGAEAWVEIESEDGSLQIIRRVEGGERSLTVDLSQPPS